MNFSNPFLDICYWVGFFHSQYEAKTKTLEGNMKEMESKKRILEEAVDSLNEEIAKLKAKGKAHDLVGSESICRDCHILKSFHRFAFESSKTNYWERM